MLRLHWRLGFTHAMRSSNITVTKDPIYHRTESPSQTVKVARDQIASQDMKQNLIDKGAIFDGNPGDRSDSKNLVFRQI